MSAVSCRGGGVRRRGVGHEREVTRRVADVIQRQIPRDAEEPCALVWLLLRPGGPRGTQEGFLRQVLRRLRLPQHTGQVAEHLRLVGEVETLDSRGVWHRSLSIEHPGGQNVSTDGMIAG